MSSVRAFQPRRYDPPRFVAEDLEELQEKIGEILSYEQCDNCGNSCYKIEERVTASLAHYYEAVCITDPDADDPEFQWIGCGHRYPIGIYDEDDVCF